MEKNNINVTEKKNMVDKCFTQLKIYSYQSVTHHRMWSTGQGSGHKRIA